MCQVLDVMALGLPSTSNRNALAADANLPLFGGTVPSHNFTLPSSQAVSKTGGHLGSSLGVIELTVALHYVFDAPEDKITWDVSHQVQTNIWIQYWLSSKTVYETIKNYT